MSARLAIRGRLIAALAATGIACVVSACGERPQVISYKQGTYQGKPDMQPWNNAPFNGDRTKWELALKDRAQTQNEYKRVN